MKNSSARRGSTRKRLILAEAVAFAVGGMISCNAPSASKPQMASTSKGGVAQRTAPPSASAKARRASNVRQASGQSPSSARPRRALNDLKGAKLSITIMGDSYSSGVGGGPYSNGRCFRSSNSMGNLYAEGLRKRGTGVEIYDVSCANSRIEQVTMSQKSAVLDSSVIDGPQAGGVSNGTDLVIMAIEGNDMGFGSLLKTCLMSKNRADEYRNSIAEARQSLNDVEGKCRRIFSVIRQHGLRSDATIAVMAYPTFVHDNSFALRDSSGGTVRVSDEIRALSRGGNKKITEIIKADNASHPGQTVFVSDVPDHFKGHQPHADRSKDGGDGLWIHPVNCLTVGSFISRYHPNAAGYRQYVAVLQNELKSAGLERSLTKRKTPGQDKTSGQGRAFKQGNISGQSDVSKRRENSKQGQSRAPTNPSATQRQTIKPRTTYTGQSVGRRSPLKDGTRKTRHSIRACSMTCPTRGSILRMGLTDRPSRPANRFQRLLAALRDSRCSSSRTVWVPKMSWWRQTESLPWEAIATSIIFRDISCRCRNGGRRR